MKIALICMPFMETYSPSLGIEILKELLRENGFDCDLFYLNLEFAKKTNRRMYSFLASSNSTSSMLGDYIFSHYVFPSPSQKEEDEYIKFIMNYIKSDKNVERIKDEVYNKIRKGVKLAGDFLEEWGNFDWSSYDVVGFTSSFQQNMACFSLAKRIKNKWGCYVLMGGANCHGIMANAIIRNFSYIDAVCNGDGEKALVELMKMLRNKKNFSIPGMVTQDNKHNQTFPHRMEMDSIPLPNYEMYLERMRLLDPNALGKIVWPYESSRGCWWGQKRQCKFCALNGHTVDFQSKNPQRVLEDLKHVTEKYGRYNDSRIFVVDNIIDMSYFDKLFPKIVESNIGASLFYETKSNLKERHIALLYKAGVRSIQPGIESLSTNILKLLNKGVSALQNVRLLRLCTEYGIDLYWNLLCGIPGEKKEDYDIQIKLVKKINHFSVPPVVGAISLYRFSPYFENATSEGIQIIGENPIYKFIYRDVEVIKSKDLFAEFTYKHISSDIFIKNVDSLRSEIWKWGEKVGSSSLFMDCEHMFEVEDDTLAVSAMTKLEKDILFLTSDISSIDKIHFKLENSFTEDEIDSTLKELLRKSWIIEEDGFYLRIALDGKKYKPSPKIIAIIHEWRQMREIEKA